MLRRLSLGLLASAISIASLPAIAQEDGSADDLGVMSISLKDVVKPTIGFQGALARSRNTEPSRHWWVLASLCWRQQRLVS